MEISYSQCGDYLIPNLVLPDEEQLTIGMAACESAIFKKTVLSCILT